MGAALLAGVKVLDRGTHVSSALASMILADFGADVTALAAPAVQTHPAAPMLMRGKRLLQAAGCAEYDQAHASAEVIITTLGPDDAVPATGAAQVHLNISGWGLKGPYARYPMVEGLVAAKSGRMMAFENMNPREGPAYAALQVASFAAAVIGVQGVLAALLEREATGQGQRVDTSLLHALMNYDTIGIQRSQLEPRYPQYLPPEPLSAKMQRVNYQPVQGRDGNWIQQGNLLDRLFQSFLRITGLKDLVPEADRKTDNQLWPKETAEMMRVAIMRRVRERDAADWLAEFKADGNVAAAPYQTTQQALDDPDLVDSGAVTDFDHPQLGKVRWLGPIAHLQATPAQIAAGPGVAAATLAAQPKASPARTPQPPLAGVTVLEFASIIATPLAMSGLSDLGARIIKVEPIGGDPGRRCEGNMGVGVSSIKLNAGKESICLELKSPKGREILDRLLPKADLIAHNFRPGVPEKLGFGYERAKTFNPRMVWISANGYGPEAPSAERPCSHPIAGAQCGGALYQAGSGMPPGPTDDIDELLEGARRLMRANEVNPDPSTAMTVATAALLGLYAARRHGTGQRIYVDMMLANIYANFDDALRYAGKPARPQLDADCFGLNALHRLYRCASGWVFLSAGDDAQFARLAAAFGQPGLAADARFATTAARTANDAALAAALGAALLARSADDWERLLAGQGLGCVRADGPVPGDFWLKDEHAGANGLRVMTEHVRYGGLYRNGPLMQFSASPLNCGAGTLAGQHNAPLLRELGYGDADIAQFAADKVTWAEPVDVHEAYGT